MSCSKCLDDFERRVLKRANVPNSVVDRRALRCPQPWLNARTLVLYAVNIGLLAASWWQWVWPFPHPYVATALAFTAASLFGLALASIAHENAVRSHEAAIAVARDVVRAQRERDEHQEREEEERWRRGRERAEVEAWEQHSGMTPHRRACPPEPHEE
mgnify:CR=1 FL=1